MLKLLQVKNNRTCICLFVFFISVAFNLKVRRGFAIKPKKKEATSSKDNFAPVQLGPSFLFVMIISYPSDKLLRRRKSTPQRTQTGGAGRGEHKQSDESQNKLSEVRAASECKGKTHWRLSLFQGIGGRAIRLWRACRVGVECSAVTCNAEDVSPAAWSTHGECLIIDAAVGLKSFELTLNSFKSLEESFHSMTIPF